MESNNKEGSRKRKRGYKERNYDLKSKYNRHKKNELPYMVVIKSPTAYRPDIFVTKHKYSTSFSLTSTSGAVAQQEIAGNDMYEPITTAIQPVGFDQLANWYGNFVVTGSSIEVQVNPRSVVGADVVVAPFFATTSTTPATMTADQLSQQPFAKRYVGFLYDKIRLKQYISTAKITGNTQERVLSQFAGTGLASPANVWNWIIKYQPSDRATTSTVDVIVNIVYYARWFSPSTQVDVPPT